MSIAYSSDSKANMLEEEKNERIGELFHSTILNYREDQSYKVLSPQIMAAFFACCFHLTTGLSFAYSAILIPQLLEAQGRPNFNITNEIYVTESDNSWIASVFPIVVPIGSIAAGLIMDSIGRINTLRLAAIPSVIGWALIASASNIPMIIVGRMLTGISSAFGVSPAIVYATEIGRPDIRGSLTSLGPTITSLGMMIGYLEGWFLSWRLVAWSCILYTLLVTVLVMLIPESPTWLISKNYTDRALKSLEWLNRYHPKPEYPIESFANTQLTLIQKETLLKNSHQITPEKSISKLSMFLKPTVYKPMIILTFLYVFLNFSGIYITLFYAVSFFEEVGTSISPYMASVQMGAARFAMSIATVWLTRKYKRRTLILASSACMAICMGFSAFYTSLIKQGSSTQTWIPISMLLLYTASTMIGFLGIPITIIGELFPTSVRGVTHSIAYGIFNLLMFASVQMYYDLIRFCGGASGLQYFFAIVSLGGMVYSYVFLPETHNKKLSDIEEYFIYNTTYISSKSSKKQPDKGTLKV